jgi:hypothetical protein
MERLQFYGSQSISRYVYRCVIISSRQTTGVGEEHLFEPSNPHVLFDAFFQLLPQFQNLRRLDCRKVNFNSLALAQLSLLPNIDEIKLNYNGNVRTKTRSHPLSLYFHHSHWCSLKLLSVRNLNMPNETPCWLFVIQLITTFLPFGAFIPGIILQGTHEGKPELTLSWSFVFSVLGSSSSYKWSLFSSLWCLCLIIFTAVFECALPCIRYKAITSYAALLIAAILPIREFLHSLISDHIAKTFQHY